MAVAAIAAEKAGERRDGRAEHERQELADGKERPSR
jgi:hypothetical protein